MLKRDEADAAAAPRQGPPPAPITRDAADKLVMNLGKSVMIKGELSGSEDLTLYGRMEGSVKLPEFTLTIGPDADIKAELLGSIFTPGSPLHDGAAIVRAGRIFAAGCTLPLSEVKSQVTALGMRHRAAIGVTEETDAVAIVVSEESRRIALAMRGQLTPPLDAATLEDMLMLHGKGSGV